MKRTREMISERGLLKDTKKALRKIPTGVEVTPQMLRDAMNFKDTWHKNQGQVAYQLSELFQVDFYKEFNFYNPDREKNDYW